MVKHVLMCKLTDPTPESVGELVLELGSLRHGLESLRALDIGVDFKRSAVSFDVVAIAVFDDRDALAQFSADLRHRAVADKVRAVCSAISIVDYETD